MADGSKKNSILRLIIIILIIVNVDLVGGYIIGSKVIIPMFYKNEEFVEEIKDSTVEEVESVETKLPGQKKPLDSINLNPADSNGEIFSCDIVLEVEGQEMIDEITMRNYEIMDKLSTYLSYKTVEELNNPNNWEKYKKDMFDIVNSTLASGEISYLYVPAKIIQFE